MILCVANIVADGYKMLIKTIEILLRNIFQFTLSTSNQNLNFFRSAFNYCSVNVGNTLTFGM